MHIKHIGKLGSAIQLLSQKLPIKNKDLKRISIGAVSLVVLLVLVYFVLIYPGQNIPSRISRRERAKIELANSKRENVLKVIQTFAGLGFIATAYFTWRNSQLTEDKNVTDRFSKAVEMLSDERLEMRIGGIYALERIARDSKEDHPVVMEVLTAFIRERSDLREPKEGSFVRSDINQQKSPSKISEDIQSALTVIGRRLTEYDREGQILNLSKANLSKANLKGADLEYADLEEASLDDANLSTTRLFSANLSYASLCNVNLFRAVLLSADLTEANLYEADLSEADFTGANLKNVELQGSILLLTNLRFAKNLTPDLITGLLCYTGLPEHIKDECIDPESSCEELPQILSKRYRLPIEKTQQIVDKAAKKLWQWTVPF